MKRRSSKKKTNKLTKKNNPNVDKILELLGLEKNEDEDEDKTAEKNLKINNNNKLLLNENKEEMHNNKEEKNTKYIPERTEINKKVIEEVINQKVNLNKKEQFVRERGVENNVEKSYKEKKEINAELDESSKNSINNSKEELECNLKILEDIVQQCIEKENNVNANPLNNIEHKREFKDINCVDLDERSRCL